VRSIGRYWSMFGSLFVVIPGFEKALVTPETPAFIGRLHLENALALAGVIPFSKPRSLNQID